MTAPRKRAAPPPPPKLFWEVHAKKLVLASAGIVAFIALADTVARPLINSRFPTASQIDVDDVDKKGSKAAADLVKQIEQLDIRQQQSIARGQSVANQLRSLRMTDLRNEIKRLEPAKDAASVSLLSRDETELEELMRQAIVPDPLPK